MNILLIGDIAGKPGRKVLYRLLPGIIENYNIDICLANCENTAGGFGVTPKLADCLFDMGIHVLTSGNHIWDKKEIIEFLGKRECRILRPANYPREAAGRGSIIIDTPSGEKVGIINLSGRIFIDYLDCPFKTADREIEKIASSVKVIIVDMHAEATSEKIALGWYLDGRVSAVLGSHTHVQTADERILPEGTAYITDVGMTGPKNSVIGIKKEIAISKFITSMPKKFEMAGGEQQFNGVTVEVDTKTGRAKRIQRIQINSEQPV